MEKENKGIIIWGSTFNEVKFLKDNLPPGQFSVEVIFIGVILQEWDIFLIGSFLRDNFPGIIFVGGSSGVAVFLGTYFWDTMFLGVFSRMPFSGGQFSLSDNFPGKIFWWHFYCSQNFEIIYNEGLTMQQVSIY